MKGRAMQRTLVEYLGELDDFDKVVERISMIVDAIDLIMSSIRSATAYTIKRELEERFKIKATLDEIDEAIETLVGMYPDKYQLFNRGEHKGIRLIPSPKPLPAKAVKKAEELLVP